MAKPITPNDVGAYKAKIFPTAVVEAFNELIAREYVQGFSRVEQHAVVSLILEKDSSITRRDIFDKGYLNVEQLYRDAGWSVVYDTPAYNESYSPFFEFRKQKDYNG